MQTKHRQAEQIGLRLKAARERAGLTQVALADAIGLEHRQSLAAIEAGERRLSADELLRAVQVLDQFEDLAGRWIATYRELSAQEGEDATWLEPRLALTPRSTFEEAISAANAVTERWELGERPAESLQAAVERHLDALVLFVDAPAGISGAASQVPRLNAVLVNRLEPEGRRNFDLAHELFHLLTWDAMPPKRVEAIDVPRGGKGKRIEQLAENFAAALLMPEPVLRARWKARDARTDLHEWLNETAADLRVSALACKWRLHNLGCLTKADLLDINDERLVANGRPAEAAPRVRPFSERFVQRIASAMDAGRLSVKRAASLLAVSMSELAALLQDYGIEPSFEA